MYREWKYATPEERKEGKGFLYSSNGVVIAILKRSSVAKTRSKIPICLYSVCLPTSEGMSRVIEEHHD